MRWGGSLYINDLCPGKTYILQLVNNYLGFSKGGSKLVLSVTIKEGVLTNSQHLDIDIDIGSSNTIIVRRQNEGGSGALLPRHNGQCHIFG